MFSLQDFNELLVKFLIINMNRVFLSSARDMEEKGNVKVRSRRFHVMQEELMAAFVNKISLHTKVE